MSDSRPPGAYRFGQGGQAVVIVPARVAAWLARYTSLSSVRINARGSDPEVYAVLHDLYIAALEWRTSATGSRQAPEPEERPSSQWLSSTEAAGRLGISDRAVRLAAAQGRLTAQRVAGRWQIAREDVEQYKAARAAREERQWQPSRLASRQTRSRSRR